MKLPLKCGFLQNHIKFQVFLIDRSQRRGTQTSARRLPARRSLPNDACLYVVVDVLRARGRRLLRRTVGEGAVD